VGLDTFVDPRREGGQVNQNCGGAVCTLDRIEGKEYLRYPTFPVHVAIIRGTSADTAGNITLEDEPVTLGILPLALAARNSGGKVIAQVRRLVQHGTLKPAQVVVPGILVDAVVVAPDQSVSGGKELNSALTGEIRLPLESIQPLPLDARKVIVSRANAEIRPGMVVNLGVGIPVDIPRIALEWGTIAQTTFFPEHGSVGGVPGDRSIFGTNINPDCIMDSADVFDFFRGGGLDATFLGFGQIDQRGNVNVSRFADIIPGCGGFIDITHKTKKVVFCGTLTSGGLETKISHGALSIVKEGLHRKMVRAVEQLTFNAACAMSRNQDVTYITERAVFKLESSGLVLSEIAPGIRLQEDLLQNVDFEVKIGSNLVTMDEKYFT